MNAPLAQRLRQAPRLASPSAARRKLDAWLAEPRAAEFRAAFDQPAVRALLLGIADHSPYLWGLIEKNPARLARLLAEAPEAAVEANCAALAAPSVVDDAAIMRDLRIAKENSALLVALADLGGLWEHEAVAAALTRFADAAVGAALRYVLAHRAPASGLAIRAGGETIEAASGMVVLAMGKQGAQELNYSSDVDLIVLFDGASLAIPIETDPGPIYVKIAQALTRLLHERTPDGYVLRVDLRLRPDPGSTPIALSLESAYAYYESVGQNWERAAMIKARPVAGDLALGAIFLDALTPFIWRKYFDYAAIADVHAMKRQIHAVKGHEKIAVAGHDIKLGRGGIREIEFFVQTQQLIFGGRRAQLRGSRTLEMLAQLHADNWVGAEAVADLGAAYLFLRRIENRLQMIDDQQTQRLPLDGAALGRFAKFCGYVNAASFSAAMTHHLRRVEMHYARLFETAPALHSGAGNLVFTGTADDPETLATLRQLGFRDPAGAAETIRGWHFGRRPAIQSARAREALTELTPALLEAFSGSGDPDAALNALDAAFQRMGAAVELFSILRSNEHLRQLFGDILGSAPRLANAVAMRPHLLDAAIDPARARPSGDTALSGELAAYLAQGRSFEDALDKARDFAAEEMFRIGVGLLSGILDAGQAGAAYSALAQAEVGAMLDRAQAEIRAEHGSVPGGRVAILALGKLGSREMTAVSDLDLILIYDFDAAGGETDGRRPIEPGHFYARLTQRFLAALSAPSKAGRLYEVDMRLRPSGRKGPLATHLQAFAQYQREEAETWEHMALCRARVVAGEPSLSAEIAQGIAAILSAPRPAPALAADVRSMRAMIAQEKASDDPWDLKILPGGLIDIEFAAQYLTLAHSSRYPRLLDVSTRAVIASAGEAGLLSVADADALCDAHRLFGAVTQIIRLAVEGRFDPQSTASGVKRRIAAAAGLPDFAALEGAVVGAREAVSKAFGEIVR